MNRLLFGVVTVGALLACQGEPVGPSTVGGPVNDTGKFLEVWKKQANGSWKCVADMFSSDMPVPVPAR